MENLETLSAMSMVIFSIFCLLLFVLWFLLPFAVFGINKKMNSLVKEQKELQNLLKTTYFQLENTNENLEKIHAEIISTSLNNQF